MRQLAPRRRNNTMKIRLFAALVLVTGLLAGSLWSQITQHFMFKRDAVSGSKNDGTNSISFSADSRDDMNGNVSVISFNVITGMLNFIISCPSGPTSVSVNPGTGNSSVNATLYPTGPGCFATPNVSAPVTITLTGRPDGTFHDSSSGNGMSTFFGISSKFNSSQDIFGETFTGTVGSASGPFSGDAEAIRFNKRSF